MGADGVREQLQRALADAMKSRERDAVSALRSALAAIANAEAVPGTGPSGASEYVAGAAEGVGASDVPRRVLDDAAMARIVEGEVDTLLAAGASLERAGRRERAEALQRQASVLRQCLDGPA